MSGELKPRAPCYSKQDFLAHAAMMYEKCVQEGLVAHIADDREAEIAWRAKAGTWKMVRGWLDELPDFQRQREREI